MHVVATAGHVDHGKSTLVRALTGMEPDRWAEERRRGMTIDLGYAWCALPSGRTVAFVDVPGHHRFVTNMLAGVGPVPAALLVVAADDGWNRQTEEHVAALDALDVRHAVVAVTRSDLADPAATIADVTERLASTTLAGAATVAVSGTTGAGLDTLRAALDDLVHALPAPISTATRLWVDRVFTIRGSGTVVTGTLSAGRIAAGDTLELSGRDVRVRGLQALGNPVDAADAVARVAVNLRGVAPNEVRRGDALLAPGRFESVQVFDVRLVDPRSVAGEVMLHAGSAAVPVHVRPFGETHARLTLAQSLPLHVGDRAILRDPGRQEVVAGVVVLDLRPPELRRRGDGARREVVLANLPDSPDALSTIERLGAVRRDHLIRWGILDPAVEVEAPLTDSWYVSTERWKAWVNHLPGFAQRWAADHPLTPAVPRDTVVQRLGLPGVETLLALTREAGLTVDESGVHGGSRAPSLPPAIVAALEGFVARWADEPFVAPEVPELRAAGLDERKLAAATRLGLVVRIASGVYLGPEAPALAVGALASVPQPFTLSEARVVLGTTRRVAVPLLELLDERGLTTRVDDQRRTVVYQNRE